MNSSPIACSGSLWLSDVGGGRAHRLYPSRAQQWQLATCSSSARARALPAPLAAGWGRRPPGLAAPTTPALAGASPRWLLLILPPRRFIKTGARGPAQNHP